MICPSCRGEVSADDWLCPFCEHVLDASVLGVDLGEEKSSSSPIRAERTKLVAWQPMADPPEAMILGDVDVSEKEFNVVQGPGVERGGRTSTFLFYTSGATSRIMHPDAIPHATQKDATIPRTPYEDFILSCIDGKRSVRSIQRASGLAPQEVVITLLTLLDKGVILVDAGASGLRGAPLPERAPIEPNVQTIAPPGGAVPESDIEELPSVSDFQELEENVETAFEEDAPTAELFHADISLKPPIDHARTESKPPSLPMQPPPLPTRIAAPPLPRPRPPSPSSANADELIEQEDDLPVMPSDLDASDSEMITDHAPAAATRALSRMSEHPSRAPSPPKSGSKLKASPRRRQTSRTASPAPSPAPAALRPATQAPPTPPSPVALKKPPAKGTTPPPQLDPEFLVEVQPSVVAPAPDPRPPARADQRRVLEKAVKRAPIEERDRRRVAPRAAKIKAAAPEPAAPAPPASPAPPSPAPAVAPKRPTPNAHLEVKPSANDAIRIAKAKKLFEEALKDRGEGNVLSARMNMKLALTFDPGNEIYAEAFDELSKMPAANSGPSTKSRARELYDLATQREEAGEVDEAIDLLEKAISESKEPAFYNRLGVILAMKKRDYDRAQEMIQIALQLAPGNATYQHNQGKILSMAAAQEVESRSHGASKKGGLLGFLGRKK